MEWFFNLKVRTKLFIMIGVSLLAIMGFCALTFAKTSTLGNIQNDGFVRDQQAITITKAQNTPFELYTIIADSVINRDLTATRQEWSQRKAKAQDDFDAIRGFADTQEEIQWAKDARVALDAYTSLFETRMLPLLETTDGISDEMRQLDGQLDMIREQIITPLSSIGTSMVQESVKGDGEYDKMNQDTITLLVTLSVVFAVVMIAFGLFISSTISSPIKKIAGISERIAQGELTLTIDEKSFTKDEVGQLSMRMGQILKRLGEYYQYILEITSTLQTMKNGDMRIHLTHAYEGEFASIKAALLGISASLNQTLALINTTAIQVSTGSGQVASGAQALASGSTEQAATVEELSTSITKIAEQAAENSLSVKTATEYVQQAGSGVTAGNEHMDQLTRAMSDIGAASGQITNITKAIEDIAFQTNILALNATIEAARAGNAGKGFAVVADEVRNLAAKSAEAAKQTAELIQASVATVSKGSQLTEQTARILREVGEKAQMASRSIEKIDKASTEQAVAIEQIKIGLNQVSAVVQTNAATAEENSATSEELSAQAAALREEVGKFKLEGVNEDDSFSTISLMKKAPARGGASTFGKY